MTSVLIHYIEIQQITANMDPSDQRYETLMEELDSLWYELTDEEIRLLESGMAV